MAAETWQMSEPRRAHPDHVIVDNDTIEIIEDAVYQLGVCRSPMGHGDAALRVHALATLIAGAEALLPDAVADARDQGHPWSAIAGQLDLSVEAARRRYSRHHRRRSLPIDVD